MRVVHLKPMEKTLKTKNSDEMKLFSGYPCLIFPYAHAIIEEERLISALKDFSKNWESHGVPVQGYFSILENRFLVAAHQPKEISGCGRDDLVSFVRNVSISLGLEWLEGARVFYRDVEGIEAVDRLEFKKRVTEGRVTLDTEVFDTTLRETDDVLAGRFALPARHCWHGKIIESALAMKATV